MKIDFNAPFRAISEITRARAEKADQKQMAGNGFGPLLSSIAPKRAESQQNSVLERISPKNNSVDDTTQHAPMAHLNMEAASALPPVLKRMGAILSLPEDSPKTDSAGVKTPTVLEVRRVAESSTSKSNFSAREIQDLINDAGKRLGIDPALGMAVAHAESAFDPQAISSDGHSSKGVFQLLDSTGKHLLSRLGNKNSYNPFDPKFNTELGVNYLRYLHDLFSEDTELPNNMQTTAAANSSSLEKLAVAAFNAGEGRVASAQERAFKAGKNPSEFAQVSTYLPESTQKYVERVMASRDRFESEYFGDFEPKL